MKTVLRWVAIVMCAACASGSTGPATPQAIAPVVISAGAASAHQQETWLAQSSSGRIVVVWIGQSASSSTIEYAISENGGVSWSAPAAIPFPSPLIDLGDPIVTADAAGNFELVALGNSKTVAEIVVFRLPAGGATFGGPVVVDSVTFGTNYFDKPQIVTTASGFLVTYSRLKDDRTGGIGLAATSPDGIVWQRDTLASNAPILIAPCADGNLVTVAYDNWLAFGLWTTSSTDGGATWTSPSQVESTASGNLTVPGCVRRGNDVWLVYGTLPSSVGLYHSTDAGAHYAPFGMVDGGGVLYGQIGLRSDGTLDVAYDISSTAVPFGFAHRYVSPGSKTFGPVMIIQPGLQLNTSSNRFAQNGYADYIGLVPGGIAFVDNSTGTSHIAFFRESAK